MNDSQRDISCVKTSPAGAEATDEQTSRVAALEEENQILQQLAAYRSAVISRVAHELRTPLTSILGFAEILLSQEQLTPQQRNFCQRIQNSGQQLQNSVSRLSEIAHIETCNSPPHLEEFALEDLLSEVANGSATQTRKRGLVTNLHPAPDLPLINSDRSRLRHAFRIVFDYVIGQTNNDAVIDVMMTQNGSACDVLLNSETNERIREGNPSLQTDLALAVAQHTLRLLGAKLSENRSAQSLQVTIQLPIDSQLRTS
jgi:K+-sensing histidine kinase KdpD